MLSLDKGMKRKECYFQPTNMATCTIFIQRIRHCSIIKFGRLCTYVGTEINYLQHFDRGYELGIAYK